VVFILKPSMVSVMQPFSLKRVGCAMAVMALATVVVCANVDTNPNPYATIVDRNPFGLKPPPPPPPPPEQTAPPVPMAKVTMTGLLSTFGEPRVILEIIEDAGKGGGTPTRPPPLREGERQGPVEVLAIDVVKSTVRLRNSGVETNITFPDIAKSTPIPGGPGVAGLPGAPGYKAPALGAPPQPLQAPQASAPTVISPNGANGGGGVTLMGGGTTATATPTSTAGLPSPLGADSGMRTIPSRPLRTETGALPPMTKEQADLLMEVNRLRGGPPSPPTPLTPIIQGAEQEHLQQQNPNAYPRLPYRGGPPALPGQR